MTSIFFHNLRILRKSKGWTIQILAEKLGIANTTISMWENGKSFPHINTILQLSEMYNIDMTTFFSIKLKPFKRKEGEPLPWQKESDNGKAGLPIEKLPQSELYDLHKLIAKVEELEKRLKKIEGE